MTYHFIPVVVCRCLEIKRFYFILPVNDDGPDDWCQQDFVSFVGEAAAVEKKGEMRADDDSKPLSEVPVPGVRAVETSHTVEDVELEEVELHHGPLGNEEKTVTQEFMSRCYWV